LKKKPVVTNVARKHSTKETGSFLWRIRKIKTVRVKLSKGIE
jgi:hypothetical protein